MSDSGFWNSPQHSDLFVDIQAAIEHVRSIGYHQPQPAFPPISKRMYDRLLEECWKRNIKGRWDNRLTVEDIGKLYAMGEAEAYQARCRAIEKLIAEGVGSRIDRPLGIGETLVWLSRRAGDYERIEVRVTARFEDEDDMVWVTTEGPDGWLQDNLEETVAEFAVIKSEPKGEE